MALTKQDLIELLEVMTPAEIRAGEKDHLDEELLQFLAERESEPRLDDALRQLGSEMAADWANEAATMPDFEPKPQRQANSWMRLMPMAVAAVFFIASFIFWAIPQPTYIDLKPEQFRTAGPKRLSGDPELEPFNAELFRVLKARGLNLLEVAQSQDNLNYLKEALRDFQQAYDLQQDDEIRDAMVEILLHIQKLQDD